MSYRCGFMNCLRWIFVSKYKFEPRSFGAEGRNFEFCLPGHLAPRKDVALGDLEYTAPSSADPRCIQTPRNWSFHNAHLGTAERPLASLCFGDRVLSCERFSASPWFRVYEDICTMPFETLLVLIGQG